MTTVDPFAFRNWTPDAQRRALDLVHAHKQKPWHKFYCPDRQCDGRPHVRAEDGQPCSGDPYGHWWFKNGSGWYCDPEFGCGKKGTALDSWQFPHARSDQRPPSWKRRWRTWLITSGRGGGKTETGARLTHKVAELVPRMIFIGATGPDFRELMVEGVSGILTTAPPGKKPVFEPSKKKLTWPNGSVGIGYSAEEPDRLRGPQSGFIWGDEWAHFDDPEACWDNALFGMRLGNPSHVLITSTPKPLPWLKTLLKDPRTIHTRVSTYANLYNLDAAYRELVIEKYEGTRKGRQELHGELLEDVEGALWDSEMIHWVKPADEPEFYDYVVVAVDPAGSCNRRSDETGIIVVAWYDGEAYVLEDLSGKYSPKGWADKAWSAHEKWSADAIVAEKNYGGEMVKRNLEISVGEGLAHIELVDSRRGKQIRAEPIVAQYEKEPIRVWHREGKLNTLEDEMLTWIPGESVSPNRVDALVHGLTHVFKGRMPAAVSNPNEVLKHLANAGSGVPGRNGTPWNR